MRILRLCLLCTSQLEMLSTLLPMPPPTLCSGGGSLVLYSDPHRVGAGGAASAAVPLRATPDTSARLCLSLAAIGETSLAAGSAAGGVAVWDVPTQRLREEYAGQHGGAAVNAVTFVPLQPSMLYSAGADGRVCLQVGTRVGVWGGVCGCWGVVLL